MFGYPEIGRIAAGLAYALPVAIALWQAKAFKPFVFGKVVKSLNIALIFHLLEAAFLAISMSYFDTFYYGHENPVSLPIDSLMETGAVFLIGFIFIHLPLLVLVNLVYWISKMART